MRTPFRVSVTALLAGLAVTLAVVAMLARTTSQRDREAFESETKQAQAAIVAKVETSVALLRGTAGLFASEDSVTVQGFRAYFDRLALRERYPGLLGIGYARWLEPGEARALTAEMHAQGLTGFRVWPDPDEARTAIVFIEPLDARNRAALGFDMWSSALRRAAMERALATRGPAASGIVELVQEIDERKQPGFLIYLPVYDEGQRLRGFAYAPTRAVDFLSSAFAHEATPEVGLEVHHGREPSASTLLYERVTGVENPRFTTRTTVELAGQPWTFVFRSRRTLAQSAALPAAVATSGILLSLLLAVLVGRERAARAEAERANRSKDQFLATLSHELRTPLHAIIGWTSLLRQPQLREEQRRQGIDVIERNARAQARLIEDLLDMSRIASGKLALQRAPLDLARLVADAVKTIQPAAESKGLELASRIEPHEVMVHGDPERIQQIVLNLLSNAMKFTPARGRIEVRLGLRGRMARLEVADTGEGVEPHLLERIFDRFAQADASTTRGHGGLGLGLAIVRQLAQLHGGRASAMSAGKGQGATFVVELPLAPDGARAHAQPSAGAPAQDLLRGVRVLAVDDDPDARTLVQALLSARGAQVCTVASAREALAALRDTPPDVLLSDIGMPGMDGYSLMREVRALPPEQGGRVPAAAITAYARESDRAAALEAGFDAHVVKPLAADALVEVTLKLARR